MRPMHEPELRLDKKLKFQDPVEQTTGGSVSGSARALRVLPPYRARAGSLWDAGRRALGSGRELLEGLLDPRRREDPAAHLYTRLAMQLSLERPAGERAKSILLTSPKTEDLVQEVAQAFAHTLAEEMGQRVLMIDTSFGARDGSSDPGVTDLLVRGGDRLSELVRPTDHERISSLPCGSPECAPESFTKGRHAALIKDACSAFDSVLLLGGPVLQDPKWLVFAPFVDHVLLLVSEGRTFAGDLDASVQALSRCKAPGLGVVPVPNRRTPLLWPTR